VAAYHSAFSMCSTSYRSRLRKSAVTIVHQGRVLAVRDQAF